MVWRMRSFQILPVLERGGSVEAFGFRTEVDGGLVVTVHTKDSSAAQSASANVAQDRAVSEVLVSWELRTHGTVVNVLNWNSR